jgi:transcriptional regulator with XRE-family HTH domain
MDAQMKINGEAVRALRERKSWSQEHLASASGLSVRTVQRVEVEGIASAETRLALAAALGVPVADLIPGPPSTNATTEDNGLSSVVANSRFRVAGATLMRKTLLGLAVAIGFAFALLLLASGISGWIPRS